MNQANNQPPMHTENDLEERRQRVLRMALKRQRKEKTNLTQEVLAALLGYKNRSSVARMEMGLTKISYDRALQWADHIRFPRTLVDQIFRAGPDEIESLEKQYVMNREIPEAILNAPASSSFAPLNEEDKLLEMDPTEVIRNILSYRGCYRVLDASMDAFRIPRGSTIYYEQGQNLRDRDIGIFGVGEETVLRKLVLNPDGCSGILLSGDVTHYPIISFQDLFSGEIKILGKVSSVSFDC